MAILIYFGLQLWPQVSSASKKLSWTESVAKYKNIINESTIDTILIDAYSELAREFMFENPDSSIYFADQAISIAQKIKRKDLEAYSLVNKSYPYNGKSDFHTADSLLNQALTIFRELESKKGVAKVLNEVANLRYYAGKLPEAIELLKEVAKLELEVGNKKRAARSNFAIGGLNMVLDNYAAAVHGMEKALYLQEELKDTFNMTTTMVQLGRAHLDLGDTVKAEALFQKTISFQRMVEDPYYNAMTQLGTIASHRKEYEKALRLYEIQYAYEILSKDKRRLAELIGYQGATYTEMGENAMALEKYTESLKLSEEIKSKSGISNMKVNIANIQIRKKEYSKAMRNLEYAIQACKELKAPEVLSKALKLQSQIFEKQGQSQKAYTAYKEHVNLKDSIFNASKLRQVTQASMTYEFKRTQMKDSLLFINEKSVLENEIQLSDTRRNWMLALLGILGLLFFQSFRNSRIRKRNNVALQTVNDELNVKNTQNQLLLEEIHHRVKNNLQVISSLLSLQSGSIKNKEAFDAVKESKNRVASMALIHQKLYQGEDLTTIEMKDYFETVGSAIIDSFGTKAKNVHLRVEMAKVDLDVDTAVPIGLITTELLTNSLKYAFDEKSDEKEVSISISQLDEKRLQLKVEDNGIGSTGEVNESGTGFGSRLVKLLTRQIEGTMVQKSEDGTSTVIEFPFEVKKAA